MVMVHGWVERLVGGWVDLLLYVSYLSFFSYLFFLFFCGDIVVFLILCLV